ncbi:MAG: hypothetical protein JWP52_3979 [Rhizobacter sp.]|nr:hypothetical protein [Rhizobacter sp.]
MITSIGKNLPPPVFDNPTHTVEKHGWKGMPPTDESVSDGKKAVHQKYGQPLRNNPPRFGHSALEIQGLRGPHSKLMPREEEAKIRYMFAAFEGAASKGKRPGLTSYVDQLTKNGFTVGFNHSGEGATFSAKDRRIELSSELVAAAQADPHSPAAGEAIFRLCKAYSRMGQQLLYPLNPGASEETAKRRDDLDEGISNQEAARALSNLDLAGLLDERQGRLDKLKGLHGLFHREERKELKAEMKAMQNQQQSRDSLL